MMNLKIVPINKSVPDSSLTEESSSDAIPIEGGSTDDEWLDDEKLRKPKGKKLKKFPYRIS